MNKQKAMSENEKLKFKSGDRVGRWTVLGEHILTERNQRKWLCCCDCGTERYVLERSLLYGGALSCGCLRKENTRKAVSHDLIGKIFGELTVLSQAENQRKNGGLWWTCKCSCGNLYDVPGTLLITGRRTHCGGNNHKKKYVSVDIVGQKFNLLTALYPTKERDNKGSVVWHCKCDCGNEIDVSYNTLVYSPIQSCGCQKKKHDEELKTFLTHIAGTSLDMIKSKKLPMNNTTGCKGVYLIKGKYVAKIVFQKKQYHLGTYEHIEDAIEARKEAEEILFDGLTAYYEKYQEKASADPEWAAANPVRINVLQETAKGIRVVYDPAEELLK